MLHFWKRIIIWILEYIFYGLVVRVYVQIIVTAWSTIFIIYLYAFFILLHAMLLLLLLMESVYDSNKNVPKRCIYTYKCIYVRHPIILYSRFIQHALHNAHCFIYKIIYVWITFFFFKTKTIEHKLPLYYTYKHFYFSIPYISTYAIVSRAVYKIIIGKNTLKNILYNNY